MFSPAVFFVLKVILHSNRPAKRLQMFCSSELTLLQYMLAMRIKWMSAVLQLSACWERGSLEPLLSGTVTRSGGLTAWPWRWPLLHPQCIRARKVKGLHINSNLKAVTNTTTIPLCVSSARLSPYFGLQTVDILIPEMWGDVSSLISCVLPQHAHTSPALLLQVTSPTSWWGTSWLRAAPKEWSWRAVPTSLTSVSGSLLPSHVHWQRGGEKVKTRALAPACVSVRSFPSSVTSNPAVIIVLTEVI